MATVSTSTITELGTKYILDRNIKGTQASADVTGSTGVIYMVEIDNEANSSAVYLKIRDAATATPSTATANGVGTPHYSFIAPAFTKMSYQIPVGAEFTTGLSVWCTTSPTVGVAKNPSKPVIIKLITT